MKIENTVKLKLKEDFGNAYRLCYIHKDKAYSKIFKHINLRYTNGDDFLILEATDGISLHQQKIKCEPTDRDLSFCITPDKEFHKMRDKYFEIEISKNPNVLKIICKNSFHLLAFNEEINYLDLQKVINSYKPDKTSPRLALRLKVLERMVKYCKENKLDFVQFSSLDFYDYRPWYVDDVKGNTTIFMPHKVREEIK